jgi:hypothetical protein
MVLMVQTPSYPRVFVVQETGIDVSSAEKHGALVTMLSRYARPSSGEYGHIRDELETTLQSATHEDWLLPVGDPVAIGIASSIFATRTGCLRMLRWERWAGRYVPITVPMVH